METEPKEIPQEVTNKKWFIDLAWYEQNKSSFYSRVKNLLCAKCSREFARKPGKTTPKELISAINECCGNDPGFINERIPILESIFRLFLLKGNQPLTLEDQVKGLSELRGDDSRITPAILLRLLQNENYYGIRQVP